METFVVRIWTEGGTGSEPDAVAPAQLRGTVHHVRTGTETQFRDPAALLAFLARAEALSLVPDPALSDSAGAMTHGPRPWPSGGRDGAATVTERRR